MALTCDLPDGRAIAVEQRPTAGGGWVGTYEDVGERRAAEAKLAHVARHDALTGLPNRLLFAEHMQRALARARRGQGIAVLCLDLDRFKAVDDTLGHAAGDELLCAVAQCLLGCTRGTNLVVRLGGDEFAVVQDDAEQPTDAAALARRVIEALCAPFEIGRNRIVVGASIGVAVSTDGPADPQALLKCADFALYRAKAGGRGTFRFFEGALDAEARVRGAGEADLRRALARGEFEPFYQPLVQPGGIAGFEALLRWRHPERGLVNPALFIPLAEEIGSIGEIGAWALRRACADAASWPGALKVAVNLSPAQFRGPPLAEEAASALAASGLPASRLEPEITEAVLLQDDDAVLDTLHALRPPGIRVAMDDFGTGYSSLSYPRRFLFDKIKIDRSFVRGLTEKEDCRAIVRVVVGLGRSLGIASNAEGVETPERLAVLRAEGCGEVQGYLFSKPEPVADVPEMLRRHGNATLPASETNAQAARSGTPVPGLAPEPVAWKGDEDPGRASGAVPSHHSPESAIRGGGRLRRAGSGCWVWAAEPRPSRRRRACHRPVCAAVADACRSTGKAWAAGSRRRRSARTRRRSRRTSGALPFEGAALEDAPDGLGHVQPAPARRRVKRHDAVPAQPHHHLGAFVSREVVPHEWDTRRRQVLGRGEACRQPVLPDPPGGAGHRRIGRLGPRRQRGHDRRRFLPEPAVQDRVGAAGDRLDAHPPGRGMERGEDLARAAPDVLVRLRGGPAPRPPIAPGVRHRLERAGLVLAPDFQAEAGTRRVGPLDQPLFAAASESVTVTTPSRLRLRSRATTPISHEVRPFRRVRPAACRARPIVWC